MLRVRGSGLVAVLLWLCQGSSVLAQFGPEVLVDADEESVAEGGSISGTCYSSVGSRRAIEMPPVYGGSLGTYRRSWEARSRVALEDQGSTVAGQFGFATSFSPNENGNHQREPFEIPPLTIVVRAAGLGSLTLRGEDTLVAGVHPAAGVILRSECDGTWLEVGARLLVPWPTEASPQRMNAVFRGSLTLGFDDDALLLPVDNAAVQLYANLTLRTPDLRPGVILGGEARIIVSVGSISVATWLGSQRGFVGSSTLGLFVAARDINLRLGGRASLSLTSLWPAGEILPIGVDGYLRWSPLHMIEAEAFLGTGGPLQGNTETLRFRWGLSVTAYIE